MWRLLATLFAVALAASACGGSDSSDDSSASGSSDAAEETEVTLAASGESLLDTIQSRGTVNCGVSGSAVAFSELQADGSMAGFDADYCRVVAAAILGDANKVNFGSDSKGYVYFIRNGNLHKIGITEDLVRRFKELAPDEILNVVRCENYDEVEKTLHARYKKVRLPQTEYFRLDDSQIAEVHKSLIELASF